MKKLYLLIILSAVLFLSSVAIAEDLALPYPEFKPATPAFASSINANFEALADGVNDSRGRITTNSDGIAVNSDNIGLNAASINAVKSELATHGHKPGDIIPQGSDSGLDADLLDGSDSTAFADSVHGHVPAQVSPQGSGSGLDADMLDGSDSEDFAEAVHGHAPAELSPQGEGSGLDADLLDGSDSEDFAGAVHGHEPADITFQGAGSGLDADKLDGSDSADFAGAVHGHTPSDLTSQGSGSGLDADMLDGNDSQDFAAAGHDHDTRYTLTGHTHPSDEITGEINADTLGNLRPSDFAGKLHSHPENALTDHNHNVDYAALDHNHEAMTSDITELKSRVNDIENYGNLSSVLDEMAAMKNTIDDLKAKVAELEKRLEKLSP